MANDVKHGRLQSQQLAEGKSYALDFKGGQNLGERQPYVFVIMEVGTRRIAHCNVTTHPTAEWTLQQFRETIAKRGAE